MKLLGPPRRQRLPMFRQGQRVRVIDVQGESEGKVVMASVLHQSLFIELEGGLRVSVLGLPRPKDVHKAAAKARRKR